VKLLLLRDGDIPPGFVYIPEGTSLLGGDREASQSLPLVEANVPGFFMSRFEVTVRDWLKFLNDPEVAPRIREDGSAEHAANWDAEYLRGAIPDGTTTVRLVVPPSLKGLPPFEKDPVSGGWNSKRNADMPIFDVSLLAALEYAHWLTVHHGKRWRYRLPTDHEWERAARGTDMRTYIWGNYPIWSYCRCVKASIPNQSKWGPFPTDESVFGVRDMAGSVSEMTIGRTDPRYTYMPLRGGNWYTTEDQYFRIANRNGRPPSTAGIDTGFRLVADLEGAR
jgi:formylglycine-generating enzyme required for sulfatase activity